jgi:hypothetical protein
MILTPTHNGDSTGGTQSEGDQTGKEDTHTAED